jgi:16S rRNA (cytidine1402-2'-O)-methyltransferase
MHTELHLIPVALSDDGFGQIVNKQIADAVKTCNHFFVENIRTARRFIASLKLGKDIDGISFELLTKDSTVQEVFEILQEWKAMNVPIGLMSEAGCPGVADPGALAVQMAHQLGIKVQPLVGPSSILLALMASGFSGQTFAFIGYLPIEKQERTKAIHTLYQANLKGQTQLFMETPFRNNQLLEDLVKLLPAHQKLCVATDLTGTEQNIVSKDMAWWKNNLPNIHKKPTIFVLGQS